MYGGCAEFGVKPPVGVMPKWLHDEQRHQDIKAAIYRMLNAGFPIRQALLDEYNEYIEKHGQTAHT